VKHYSIEEIMGRTPSYDIYYNPRTQMFRPIKDLFGKNVKLPIRKDMRQRVQILDSLRLFECPQCMRIVPWNFGADVGHPDATAAPGQIPLPYEDDLEAKDRFLRLCCDDCWHAVIVEKKPLNRWWKQRLATLTSAHENVSQ
jgi:hypothetical protein